MVGFGFAVPGTLEGLLMYLGWRDREVVYIYIPISFDAEISWRRTYSDNESTSPKKKILGPGFQVRVSLYLYIFSFFSLLFEQRKR